MNKKISFPSAFFVLLAAIVSYYIAIKNLPPLNALFESLVVAFLSATILWLVIRVDLAKTSICFLALPYFIFIPGWLNPIAATFLLIIFSYSLYKTIHNMISITSPSITIHDLLAFILILAWVNLSGAGGYGYQTYDYVMHNARLKDLVDLPWPIRYGENQNFVYYFGYFLPSAIIGKVSNFEVAQKSIYLWTVLGVALSMRWLSCLSTWRLSIGLVLIFIFFGPMDILSVLYRAYHTEIFSLQLHNDHTMLIRNSDYLDFSSSYQLGFGTKENYIFLGNYLSNTFQLFWSPQQVISGWLCICLLTFLFIKKEFRSYFFIYALLALWAPLPMIAIAPFGLVTLFWLRQKPGDLLTFENTLGAGTLVAVFIIFYLAGSSSSNPSFWILAKPSFRENIDVILIFYLFGWAIYALSIGSHYIRQSNEYTVLFFILVIALTLLPLRTFGEFSDLLCRGSAPLMLLLLALILRAVKMLWTSKQNVKALAISSLLLLGICSAIATIFSSVYLYGQVQASESIITYGNAYPNLGPDGTLFEKWLRKSLPEHK